MITLLKNTLISWHKNDPYTHSASIAYYTIFSFPALIIILMEMFNFFIDRQYIETSIIGYLGRVIGQNAAAQTFQTVDKVNVTENNTLFLILGVVMLFLTSLRLFMQIQRALNNVWGVESQKFSWKNLLYRRAYSFGVIISIGFILLVSLLVTSALTSLSDWMSNVFSDWVISGFHIINILFSLTTISILFAIILAVLPDKTIPWSAAFRGGVVSAVLFMLGQYGLGIYFDLAEPQSAYGVSGSLILLILWVSYSAHIMLLGAEFSKQYMEIHHEI